MAQLLCIGLYKPCIHLPFGDCAMYFDHGVYWLFFHDGIGDPYFRASEIIPI